MEKQQSRHTRQRLILMSFLFFVFVNFPLILIFDRPQHVLGIPILPLAIFSTWFVWIIVLAILLERNSA